MTNEAQQPTAAEEKRAPFGKRLKSKRESLGLERKDAAAQLRLNEKIIIMMENDKYSPNLPITFVRGYLRSYAKFLQIPEFEVNQALAPIKQKIESAYPVIKPIASTAPAGSYFMSVFTYLVVFTLVGLVGTWWYRHPPTGFSLLMENKQTNTRSAAAEPQPFAINNTDMAETSTSTNKTESPAEEINKNDLTNEQSAATSTTEPTENKFSTSTSIENKISSENTQTSVNVATKTIPTPTAPLEAPDKKTSDVTDDDDDNE